MSRYKVFKAENLEFMSTLNQSSLKRIAGKEHIDFIYIDPPFNTSKSQARKSIDFDKRVVDLQYYDDYGDGLNGYLEFMRLRLEHCYRLLNKETGILCVHLDYNAVHYVKSILDHIFGGGDIDQGKKHLINEIIVRRNKKQAGGSNKLSVEYDTLLLYKKNKNKKLNKIFKDEISEAKWRNDFEIKEPPEGRPLQKFPLFKTRPKKQKRWRWSKEETQQAVKNYNLYLKHYKKKDFDEYAKNNRELRFVRQNGNKIQWYKHHKDKVQIKGNDWLSIKAYDPDNSYPTAKHTDLLDRLIDLCSKKGDLVADFFCGCGVTLKSSLNKDRSFIGCDGQNEAIKEIKKYLQKNQIPTNKVKFEDPFKNIPKEFSKIKDNHVFSNKVVLSLGGVPTKPVGDGGFDGKRIKDGALIEVKRGNCSRPQMQSFIGVLTNNKIKTGLYVAKNFTKEAKECSYKARNQGIFIELITLKQFQTMYIYKEKGMKKNKASNALQIQKEQKKSKQKRNKIKPSKKKARK